MRSDNRNPQSDTLLICLLPEMGLKYQRLYAYLADDVTKKSPTIDTTLRFPCDSFEDSLRARKAFYPEAPLIKYHLVHLYDEYQSNTTPLLSKSLKIYERITSYLLETDQLDARLLSFASLVRPSWS